jgi:hypothetical protein
VDHALADRYHRRQILAVRFTPEVDEYDAVRRLAGDFRQNAVPAGRCDRDVIDAHHVQVGIIGRGAAVIFCSERVLTIGNRVEHATQFRCLLRGGVIIIPANNNARVGQLGFRRRLADVIGQMIRLAACWNAEVNPHAAPFIASLKACAASLKVSRLRIQLPKWP